MSSLPKKIAPMVLEEEVTISSALFAQAESCRAEGVELGLTPASQDIETYMIELVMEALRRRQNR